MSKTLFHIVCVLLCLATVPHHGDTQSQTVAGRPGKKGAKGDRGEIGPAGPPGVVDYDRIEAAVLEHISPADIDSLTAKVDTLIQSFGEIKQTCCSRPDENPNAGFCDVVHERKCFHAVVHVDQDVSLADARRMCQKIGMSLANIYISSHQAKIANYLRGERPSTRDWIGVWLGMTIDPPTEVVRLSSGTVIDIRASGMKWYPGYPTGNSAWTKMGFNAADPSQPRQGLHDYPVSSGYKRHGALCEK